MLAMHWFDQLCMNIGMLVVLVAIVAGGSVGLCWLSWFVARLCGRPVGGFWESLRRTGRDRDY